MTKETILCKVFSKDWNREMPATLIKYDNKQMDIHIQTGDHYDECMKKAILILSEMGLKVVSGDEMIGPTGVYNTVERI